MELQDKVDLLLKKINSYLGKTLPFSALCQLAKEADQLGLELDRVNPGDSTQLALAFHPLYLNWERRAGKADILKAAKESQFGDGIVSILLYTNLYGTAEMLGEKTSDVDFFLDLLLHAPSKGIKSELKRSLQNIMK